MASARGGGGGAVPVASVLDAQVSQFVDGVGCASSTYGSGAVLALLAATRQRLRRLRPRQVTSDKHEAAFVSLPLFRLGGAAATGAGSASGGSKRALTLDFVAPTHVDVMGSFATRSMVKVCAGGQANSFHSLMAKGNYEVLALLHSRPFDRCERHFKLPSRATGRHSRYVACLLLLFKY